MTATTTLPAIGDRAFGIIGNHPPSLWAYEGVRCGAHVLIHVPKPTQSRSLHDQLVSAETLRRLFAPRFPGVSTP